MKNEKEFPESMLGKTLSTSRLGLLGFSVSYLKKKEIRIIKKEGFNATKQNLCMQINKSKNLTFLAREVCVDMKLNYEILKIIKS